MNEVNLEAEPVVSGNENALDVQAYKAKARRLEYVNVALVSNSDAALRDVKREDENFLHLLHSIKRNGVLKPILVREVRDPHTGGITFGLIDGLQRFTCAKESGLTTVPAQIVDMDDSEILEVQLVANLAKIETKPAEYAKHLLRMLQRDPFLTKRQLAERISQSLGWVEDRLSLDNLVPDIQKLVDEGTIHLTNAYALAKLPEEEQASNVDAAINESPKSFVPRMKARVKELKDAKKKGTDASDANEFKPSVFMQKVGEVKTEFEQGLPTLRTLLSKKGLTSVDAQKGAELAIAWILNSDEDSIAAQVAKHEARQAKKKAEEEKRKKDKEEKKAQLAAEKAADVTTGL